MGDGYIHRFLSRFPFLFRMVAVLVFVFSAETNNHQPYELSDPTAEVSPDCRCSLSRVISIRLYCDVCPWLMFVPGGFFHRWYLRLLTDALSPLHLFGVIIWVFDPGINRNSSLKGKGFNKTRIDVTQGRSMISNWQRCARHYIGIGDVCLFCYVTGDVIDDPFFSTRLLTVEATRRRIKRTDHHHEGARRRHNTSSGVSFLFQREADGITISSKSSQQLKVMLKAFWSFSYMLLAINIKYMKGGSISLSLIARKAYVQQAGLIHSIIETTASHICEKRLYLSLSLLYERLCDSNCVYQNVVLFGY